MVHWRLERVGTTGCWCPLLPVTTWRSPSHPGPQQSIGRSVLVCPPAGLASPFFPPSTARTALLTDKSLLTLDCRYTTKTTTTIQRPILRLPAAAVAATHHTHSPTPTPTPTPTRWSRPSVHCCSPLRASQTRQSAQKLRTSPSHHPLPPTLANAQYRPNRHANHHRPDPNPALLDSISNRPDQLLPHSPTPLKPFTAVLPTLRPNRDCASTRMSSSSN